MNSTGGGFIFYDDNKQTEVKRDGITIGRYFYDGEGRRVKKVTDTETTVFVYSGGLLIAEYSTAISQTPSVSYTTADHLGSPRVITNELGQVSSRRDFMPFGEVIGAFEWPKTQNLKDFYLRSVSSLWCKLPVHGVVHRRWVCCSAFGLKQ